MERVVFQLLILFKGLTITFRIFNFLTMVFLENTISIISNRNDYGS